MTKKGITKREENYSKWYLDILEVADLAENSPVRGCMTIRPNGYAIWENIQKFLDIKIKETGHYNVYFPLFIPKSFLSKEAEHVKGFAKECAVVTHHRLIESPDGKSVIVDPDAKLEEELIVRPTSETIMYETFSRWVTSWRDLPLLTNQWNNVVRWELRTRPFIRTSEFLWQEGHTAHTTHEQAIEEVLKMLNVYKQVAEELLAIPVIMGYKSDAERFAGALKTYTIESLMQDGKALQSATSHDLGQNFSKAFEIKFTDKDGSSQNVWQTSWGMSTRIMGALIMSHADDQGMVIPPKVAPIQVVIVPIYKDENKLEVLNYCRKIEQLFSENSNDVSTKISLKLDDRDFLTPGAKFNEWEKKGIPVRIEIGPKDILEEKVTLVRRDTLEKTDCKKDTIVEKVTELLDQIQKNLFQNALKRLEENTHEASDYDEFKKILDTKKGFIKAFWCERPECEEAIKAETKATTRCLPVESKDEKGKCIYCGKEAKHKWIFAIAY